MGTDGVKVAQQGNAPFLVCVSHTGEDLLRHKLSPTVWIGAVAGAGSFPQGHFVIGGIDSGGRGEDDLLTAGFLHHLGQHQGGVEIVVIVFPGLCNGFTHRLQTGKVNDTGDLVFGKDLLQ